jgi:hypothetical protein
MLWDEHGGTFVIRVEDLQVEEMSAYEGEGGLTLELPLSPAQTLLEEVAAFAAQHRLALTPPPGLPREMEEPLILAACHLPGQNLFVYGESLALKVRPGAGPTLEFSVAGNFRSRRLPSREIDLVLHLTPVAMTRLLSYVYTKALELIMKSS